MRRLWVEHGARPVGTLDEADDGTVTFTYERAWLQDGFAISASLPLREEPHGEAAHRFFSNLLPEADLRRSLCQRLGISVDNDFELLAAIGGECAGALTLLTAPATEAPRNDDYEPISHKKLSELAKTRVLPAIDGQSGLRLSLAGAQDKLPVKVEGDKLFLPRGSSPSTHILKFANRDFKHLPGNEVLTMLIAKHLGLPTAEATLFDLGREGACLVTRYDRIRTPDGAITRLHQEDLCQALGIRSTLKYEKEGGPAFAKCFELVREKSAQTMVDQQNLLRWLAFNAIAFNADAHAKNLSLLYTPRGTRLAPFYDLLCTRAYPRLSRALAMSIGGVAEPTNIIKSNWQKLEQELGLGRGFAVRTARDVAERFAEASKNAEAEFKEKYGKRAALELVLPKVRRQARRILKQLA